MPVFLSLRTVGSITILELGEHLKAENVSEFRDMFQYLTEQGRIHVLLDGSRLRIIDSLGIGSLVGNWVSLRKRGGKLGLLNPSDRLREVLRIAGMQDLIESFDDISNALPSLAKECLGQSFPVFNQETARWRICTFLRIPTGRGKDYLPFP